MRRRYLVVLVCMFATLALAQVTLTPFASVLGDQPLDYFADTPFIVTNMGTGPVMIGTATISPSNGPFSIYRSLTSDCGSLPQNQLQGNGAFCTLWVRFAPTAAGPASATLTVPYGGNQMLSASLGATGIHDVTFAPMPLLPPYHITCNVYVGLGTYNPGPCIVTLVNHQPISLTVSHVTVTDTENDDAFAETDNCIGNSIPPYGSCTITVQFNGPDGELGNLNVTTNNPDGSPATLRLQGSCRRYTC